MYRDLVLGLNSFAEAHRLIVKNGFWIYLLVPGIINLILFVLSFKFFLDGSAFLTDRTLELVGLDSASSGFLEALRLALYWTLFVILRLLFLLLYFSVYKYIVLIVLAPVLAWVSEKTEETISGKSFPFSIVQFMRDIVRGVVMALRNLAIEMAIFICLWVLAFIPLVGLLAPFLMFAVQSYFYGFSMMDYYNERRKMKVSESIKFIYNHKGIAVANGAVFYGLFLIPLIGWIVSPIYSVIAATISLEKLKPAGFEPHHTK